MKKDNNINIPLHLVQKFLDFLKTLSPAELKDLEMGDRTIRFSMVSPQKKGTPTQSAKEILSDPVFSDGLKLLKEELYNSDDKEGGFLLLEKHSLTRNQLAALAKLLDIPVTKRDSVEHVKRKIVDATIGFRLRSQAIRGR